MGSTEFGKGILREYVEGAIRVGVIPMPLNGKLEKGNFTTLKKEDWVGNWPAGYGPNGLLPEEPDAVPIIVESAP